MYWKQKGSVNTGGTVELVLQKARETGIRYLVAASNSGATAERFIGHALDLVCVTHHVGFVEPGHDEMTPEMRRKLQEKGVKVLTTTHLLAGVDRGVRNKFQGIYPAEIIASALRIMGQGLKVCVEISVMALDAGLIPYGEEIIAVAGSGGGADTAVIIVPAHSTHFFDTTVKEIICIPREK